MINLLTDSYLSHLKSLLVNEGRHPRMPAFFSFLQKMVLNDTIYISYYDIMEVIKMDYKYFITEITTSNRLVFKENATTAVNKN